MRRDGPGPIGGSTPRIKGQIKWSGDRSPPVWSRVEIPAVDLGNGVPKLVVFCKS